MLNKTIIFLSAFACSLIFTTIAVTASGAEENTISAAMKQDINWYTIQVISSREAQDATEHVALLKAHGLAAVSSYEAVEGKGMWYRVYVGRFRTTREAKIVASRLEAEGIISGYWIKPLTDPDILPVASEQEQAQSTVAEKEESLAYKKTQAPSDKPVEPQVSPEDQVKEARPPQLNEKREDTTIIASSEEDMGKPMPVEEPLTQTSTPELKIDDKSLFSVALRPGGIYIPNLDEFTISTPTTVWYFKKKYFNMAIVPSFYFNDSFSLEGSLEKILNAKFDFWYATLGPKWRLTTPKKDALFNLSPYIRGALTHGKINWDDAPGSFDGSLGWDLGIGLDVIAIHPTLKLGLETSYRGIGFNYNIPSNADVTSSKDKMDFSGFSFTGFLNFYF